MSEEVTGVAITRDGVSLHTLRLFAVGVPRAHVLLVHGIAEHSGRHRHVAARLARAGFEMHSYDLRGFGASGGTRAYVARWSEHLDDLEDRLDAVRAVAVGLPVVLYGHSMGGLIALGYVLADPSRRQPDLLVLSAPAIAAPVPKWKRALAPVLGRALPRLRLANGLPSGGLSHDPAVEVAYRADALNTHSTTARLGLEFLREQDRVASHLARFDRLPLPTYVLHGSDDAIVPVSASAALGGKTNVTRRVYDGMRHEMHNEPEGPSIIDDTVRWIENAIREVRGTRALPRD